MERLGIAFSGGPNASEIVACVRLAEELGYESAWIAEGHGGDQFAILAACAVQTSRIRLGTAITSVFVRSAPTIAMAALTVDELSAGRFVLGIGSSHRVQVEPEHGATYDRPLTRVRETVELVRELARAGEVVYHGDTVRIERFDLWFTPRRGAVPVYLSALFPKMLALAGEVADGVILTRTTLDTIAAARQPIAEGAERGGRDSTAIEIATLLPTSVGATREEALAAMRPGIALYAGFFPRYNRYMAAQGFAAEAAAIAEAWQRGDRERAAAAVSDALVDATSIAGTAATCRERIARYRAAGVDLPIISPFARGAGARARFEAVIRACAPG